MIDALISKMRTLLVKQSVEDEMTCEEVTTEMAANRDAGVFVRAKYLG